MKRPFELLGLKITSSPSPSVEHYTVFRPIQVTASFSHRHDQDLTNHDRVEPSIKLQIGDNERTATWRRGSGNDIIFQYYVTTADQDHDGFSVIANSIEGDFFILGAVNIDGSTIEHDAIDAGKNHRVHSHDDVTSVEITSDPGNDKTYRVGDTIVVTVTFSENVQVDFGDRDRTWEDRSFLVLLFDDDVQKTAYIDVEPNTAVDSVEYKYTVQVGDSASNGVARLYNGISHLRTRIRFDDSGDTVQLFDIGASADSDHLVDGSLNVDSIEFTTSQGLYTYVTGEVVEVLVRFDSPVSDAGDSDNPLQLALQIGDDERKMNARSFDYDSVYFTYTITNDDLDTVGMSIDADALSGSIEFAGTTLDASTLTHDAHVGTGGQTVNELFLIDWVLRDRPPGDVFYTGDVISLLAYFSLDVFDDSELVEQAYATIQVGEHQRIATLTYSDDVVLEFSYVVTDEDSDADGIVVPANALAGEGLIRGDEVLDLTTIETEEIQGGSSTVVNQQPVVASFEFTSDPGDNGLYRWNETVTVEVTFNSAVYIDGEDDDAMPTVDLDCAGNYLTATATSARDVSTTSLEFEYTVSGEYNCDEGVGIRRTSLKADESPIRFVEDDSAVNLLHRAVGPDSNHVIDALVDIESITVTSSPATDLGYRPTNSFTVEMKFEEPVKFTAEDEDDYPPLTVFYEQGFNTKPDEWTLRTITYTSGNGTDTLVYTGWVIYGVEGYHGIRILPISPTYQWPKGSVVQLNGGKVNESFATVAATSDQRVYGGILANDVEVTSSPENDEYYETDETFTFEVSFPDTVAIESKAKIKLQVGDNERWASMASRHDDELSGLESLSFEYTFIASDADADGIEILDTWWRVNDSHPNGYIFPEARKYRYLTERYISVWKFINTSPGILSDHKVGEPEDEEEEEASAESPVGIPWDQ